ncbi:hypothetical protein OH76DRAFT_1413156 [Lentinus brumalis]|uniref:GST N-terminal domain-containing protein n=1 Tax=Lentinus brumalis TaxID=2498619 RepID=A0A371CIN2_9APHY|nr:hypothetical protein OH76DRAFT_1413156 [Polyporus brumalis]
MAPDASNRITVYVATESPFSHRVTYALEETKIPHDPVWIDLFNKPDWFRQNVHGVMKVCSSFSHPLALANHAHSTVQKVPYLVHGGPQLHEDEEPGPGSVRIPESLVILEYLADVFPTSGLLPADPVLRAKARLFIQSVETKFIPAFVGFLFMGAPVHAILGAIDVLQSFLPAEGFVVGTWSIADATFAPFFLRLETLLKNGLGLYDERAGKEAHAALHSERFARIQTWITDNLARPSLKQTWDEEHYIQKYMQRLDIARKTGTFAPGLDIPANLKQK